MMEKQKRIMDADIALQVLRMHRDRVNARENPLYFETMAGIIDLIDGQQREINAYNGAGLKYEEEIAKLNETIARQCEQLKKAAARLILTGAELEAAKKDLNVACETCRNYSEQGCMTICKLRNGKPSGWEWRGAQREPPVQDEIARRIKDTICKSRVGGMEHE